MLALYPSAENDMKSWLKRFILHQRFMLICACWRAGVVEQILTHRKWKKPAKYGKEGVSEVASLSALLSSPWAKPLQRTWLYALTPPLCVLITSLK